MSSVIQYVLYLAVLVILAIPLGAYIKRVMNGEKTFLSKILTPCENLVYNVMKVDKDEQMTWKKYAVSVLVFSGIGLVFLFLLQLLQGVLPGNPQNIPGTSWHLAFNTAASFVTNTNWQAYSGESTLSYLTQALGLTVQNFVSAATGIAVLFALVRGFVKVKETGLGSFWVDMTRIIVHILLPLNLVISVMLVGGGVIQNLKGAESVQLLEPIAVSSDGEIIENAVIDTETGTVTRDGEIIPDAEIVTEEFVPMGPAASQVAIKQTGTNGGGYMGVNSAHPLENPNAFTNFVEMLSILLIPVALCFTFGSAVGNKKQGIAVFLAMFICLAGALAIIGANEQTAVTALTENSMVDTSTSGQAGGNMEGKETRFGIAASSTWAAFTTAASNGSVNSMHDSYTPLGGMVAMLQMQLGEVIFGGTGCGLYGMLAFAILTVFIAGLMVGRTPEFLGKKIEPFEMKWAVLVCLATPIGILVGSGIAAAVPAVADSLNNGGAHGFSELLYAYSSAGGNNGSAFAGFNANTPFLNVSIGLVMLFVRFLPIIGTLAIAGSLAQKKKLAVTAGTLSTTNAMFVFLLIVIVLLIANVFHAPKEVIDIISSFVPIEEPKAQQKAIPVTPDTAEELSIDENGEVSLDEGYVIGKTADVFGPKIYENISNYVTEQVEQAVEMFKETPDTSSTNAFIDKLKKDIREKTVAPILSTVKSSYGFDIKKSDEKEIERRLGSESDVLVNKAVANFNIAKNTTEQERQKALKQRIETQKTVEEINHEFDVIQEENAQKFQAELTETITEFISNASQQAVETVETKIKSREKDTVEDSIRDHLRGFSRTIPSFLMAYIPPPQIIIS